MEPDPRRTSGLQGRTLMCQLLGMNANVPTDIMFSFSGFAKRSSEHADGFGIAFFENKGVRSFVDHQAAEVSPVAELIKRYPIRSNSRSGF